jgi:hypothetical protein
MILVATAMVDARVLAAVFTLQNKLSINGMNSGRFLSSLPKIVF